MADIVKLIYKGDEMAQGGGSASVDPATRETAGTVRVATESEIKDHKTTGDDGAFLVMTPYDINKYGKTWQQRTLHAESGWPIRSTQISGANETTTVTVDNDTYIHYTPGILIIEWDEYIFNGSSMNSISINGDNNYWYSPVAAYEKVESCSIKVGSTTYYPEMKIHHRDFVSISGQGDPEITLTNEWTDTSITGKTNRITVVGFIETNIELDLG